MPRYKEDLNAVYVSERMQECLRGITESSLTTVIAPMGYGKTTAILWFLNKRYQLGEPFFRVNIYSGDIDLFWKSFCAAFRQTALADQMEQFGSVSYTHLDVYKRQVLKIVLRGNLDPLLGGFNLRQTIHPLVLGHQVIFYHACPPIAR